VVPVPVSVGGTKVSTAVTVGVTVTVPVGVSVSIGNTVCGDRVSVCVNVAVEPSCADTICVENRVSMTGMSKIITARIKVFRYRKRILEFISSSLNWVTAFGLFVVVKLYTITVFIP
jgi:hypothetical protein